MARVGIVFGDGVVRVVETEHWEPIDSGGEADIYFIRTGGVEYVAKVFTESQTKIAKPIERMSEIIRRLSRARHRCGTKLPRSLYARGLPLGFGSHEGRAVLVFRSLEGFKTLADIITDEGETLEYMTRHSDAERAGFAHELLRGLACLEYIDVFHIDITTANAAYGFYEGKPGIFLFDIEAAGLIGHPDYPLAVLPARDTHYMPVEILGELGIPIRSPEPEELPLDLSPSKMDRGLMAWVAWAPLWYGLQLVAYAYSVLSPFQGLPAMSAEHWRPVVEGERRRGYPGGWPPQSMVELGYLDSAEYRELRKIWSRMGDRFVSLMYQTFVVDLGERRSLPLQTLSSLL